MKEDQDKHSGKTESKSILGAPDERVAKPGILVSILFIAVLFLALLWFGGDDEEEIAGMVRPADGAPLFNSVPESG